MTTLCHPLPRDLGEEMLQVSARAMCDRPGDNAAQRDSRTRQMVHTTLGFEPRDGIEFMIATVAVGHYHLILDSVHDVFHGQDDSLKAKTKTTIVSLDRAMLEMIRELRIERRRPLARPVEEPAQETVDAAAPQAPPATPDVAVPPDIPAEAPRPEAPPAPSPLAEAAAVVSVVASGLAQDDQAQADPASSRSSETRVRPMDPAPVRAIPVPPPEWRIGMPLDWWPEIALPDGQIPLPTGLPSFEDDDGGSFEEHFAILKAALAAMEADNAEARARDEAEAEATSG